MNREIHQGRNVKYFRDLRRFTQAGLAMKLGGSWNQRKVSVLESKAIINEQILIEVSAALSVPVDAIKELDEQEAITNIQNNFKGFNTQTNIGTINIINDEDTIKIVSKLINDVSILAGVVASHIVK